MDMGDQNNKNDMPAGNQSNVNSATNDERNSVSLTTPSHS